MASRSQIPRVYVPSSIAPTIIFSRLNLMLEAFNPIPPLPTPPPLLSSPLLVSLLSSLVLSSRFSSPHLPHVRSPDDRHPHESREFPGLHSGPTNFETSKTRLEL
eukprot:761335-Hanusia_phi.AAC.1